MKFLGQQITSVLFVVLVALAISGYRVSEYMIQSLYDSRETQLVDYGQNIIKHSFTRSDLEITSELLAGEDIHIQVHLADGRTIFPTYDQRNRSKLDPEDLHRLQEGEVLGLQSTERFVGSEERIQQLTVYVPILYDRGPFPKGFLSLSTPLSDVTQQVDQIQTNIIQSFGLASVLALLVGIAYAMWQTHKVRRLQAATQKIMQDDYDVDLDLQGDDELGELARDFQQMSEYLRASEEEIRRQEDLRQEFMMDVMHEMRTPLTTMAGLLEGLELGMIPEQHRQRSLELIHQETKRLTRLVNQQLDYEKLRSDQLTLAVDEIDGQTFLEEIQTQMTVSAKDKGNTIDLDLAPSVIFEADRDRLRQIVINLVNNANQFSQNSVIELAAWMEEGWSVLSVSDQGIGMTADQVDRIWERFYKADESRKNTKLGESGIGLSVVKLLVDAHQGQIHVTSQVGEGTRFEVRLPMPSPLSPKLNREEEV